MVGTLKHAGYQNSRKDSRSFFLISSFGIQFRRRQVRYDLAELLEAGFEVIDDFSGENVGVREIVGFFEGLIPEPKDVEAGFVAVDDSPDRLNIAPCIA